MILLTYTSNILASWGKFWNVLNDIINYELFSCDYDVISCDAEIQSPKLP